MVFVKRAYWTRLKFATIFLLSFTVTSIGFDDPLAPPDHPVNLYSALGVATRVTVLPSLYVPWEGTTFPPCAGLDLTSTTNSLVQLESETTNIKRSSFFRILIYGY